VRYRTDAPAAWRMNDFVRWQTVAADPRRADLVPLGTDAPRLPRTTSSKLSGATIAVACSRSASLSPGSEPGRLRAGHAGPARLLSAR